MEDQSPVLLHLSFYAIGISAWFVTTAVFGEGAYLVGVLPEEDKLFAAVDLAMVLVRAIRTSPMLVNKRL